MSFLLEADVSPSRTVFGPRVLLSVGRFTFLECLFATSISSAKHMWTEVCQPNGIDPPVVPATLGQHSQMVAWIPFVS